MTTRRDGDSEMRELPDPRTAALVRAAQGPAEAGEIGADQMVASIAEAIRSAPALTSSPGRKSMLAKVLTAKVAAIGGIALFGATAAAASTGSLPAPAQTGVSKALDKAGISVPKGKGAAKSEYGHCKAFLNGPGDGEKYTAKPFAALIEAHGGVEGTKVYCEGVVAAKHADKPAKTTTTTATGSTTSSSTTKTTGKPEAPGKSTEHKPEDAGKPDDKGKPDDAGKPSTTTSTTEADDDDSDDSTTSSSTATKPQEPAGGKGSGSSHSKQP